MPVLPGIITKIRNSGAFNNKSGLPVTILSTWTWNFIGWGLWTGCTFFVIPARRTLWSLCSCDFPDRNLISRHVLARFGLGIQCRKKRDSSLHCFSYSFPRVKAKVLKWWCHFWLQGKRQEWISSNIILPVRAPTTSVNALLFALLGKLAGLVEIKAVKTLATWGHFKSEKQC